MANKNNNQKGKGTASKSTGGKTAKNAGKGAGKAAKGAGKAVKELEKRAPMPRAISSIILVAIGAFLIISLQTQYAGMLGSYISSFLKGVFGLMAYVTPYLLILYAALQLFKAIPPINFKNLIKLFGLHLSLALMNSSRFVRYNAEGSPGFKETFKQGVDLEGGGLLGMYIGTPIYKVAGMAGLIIIALALFLICLLLLSGGNVRERFNGYRDERDEKRETKIQKKMEKKLLKRKPYGADQYDEEGFGTESDDEPMTIEDKLGGSKIPEQLEIEYPPHTTEHSSSSAGGSQESGTGENSGFDEYVNEAKREQERKGFLAKLAGFAKNEAPEDKKPVRNPSVDELPVGHGRPQWDGDLTQNQKDILDLVYSTHDFGSEEERPGYGLDGTEPDTIAQEPERNIFGWQTEGFEDPDSITGPDESAASNNSFDIDPNEKILDHAEHVVIGGASVATAKSSTEDEDVDIKVTPQKRSRYKLPPLNILKGPDVTSTGRTGETKETLNEKAALLERTLASFKVDAKVTNVITGPSVTRYELEPAIGVKVGQITSLSDDIALSMRARSIRIEAPIPGKAAVGIEIENAQRQTVTLREIIGSSTFRNHKSKLAFTVGRDIGGNAVVADLAKMPHLLIAGATGSGKSVCINTIIASILYKAKPEEVKMILIDPKMVELNVYNGTPHLMVPVVTDATKAAGALNWAVAEMTERYKKFASNGVRDIGSFNSKMKELGNKDEILPQIVIIIDELSDLMMVAKNQVEDAVCRLAQLARAAGMHLVIATQRPSVDVITGLIKANIPSRIAFMVSSMIDSRTIIDMPGAEHLVGNGDMLFKPQDLNKPKRIQGPFVSEQEIRDLIDYVSGQVNETEYNQDVIDQMERGKEPAGTDEEDDLLIDAVGAVVAAGQCSVSMLQRRFRIGYNRAARIVDIMESKGIVGPQDGSRPRQVLYTEADYIKMKEEAGRLI